MGKIEATLISGRTSKQGIGLEEGKTSGTYIQSVNHVQLSTGDTEKLELEKESKIKITTTVGSVVVNWVEDKNLDQGLVFFPYGPWANQLYASETGSTGMPLMKSIEVVVEKTNEKVLTLEEIVEKLREDVYDGER